MGLATVHSRALLGVNAPSVTVEVHLANGLPSFTLVGLPETEVKEARDRVRAAIQTSRFDFPMRRITVNLAPADLPKDSGRFDLPIAIGILAASGQIPAERLADHELAGELGLDGSLRPIRGALAMCWQARHRTFILPQASAAEAAVLPGGQIRSASHLLDVTAYLARQAELAIPTAAPREATGPLPDLADLKGQQHARRALEIAAAGGHSLLLIGPPGTGKSMLAQRLPGILPPMSPHEALESAAILSLTGQGLEHPHFGERPFRAPHHTASAVALVGGGSQPRPGEISLAHHGVLFLDELPEFSRNVLEVLREPLESRRVVISRAARQAEFPANFQLIAAMNPCPCGHHGSSQTVCRCSPDQIQRYRSRLSGPLLDRLDMAIEMPALAENDLLHAPPGEASATVRQRVLAAHARQQARQQKNNAALTPNELEQHAPADAAGEALLRQAIQRLNLSARSYHRILRLARTIADLASSPAIAAAHIAEAIQYRRHLGS